MLIINYNKDYNIMDTEESVFLNETQVPNHKHGESIFTICIISLFSMIMSIIWSNTYSFVNHHNFTIIKIINPIQVFMIIFILLIIVIVFKNFKKHTEPRVTIFSDNSNLLIVLSITTTLLASLFSDNLKDIALNVSLIFSDEFIIKQLFVSELIFQSLLILIFIPKYIENKKKSYFIQTCILGCYFIVMTVLISWIEYSYQTVYVTVPAFGKWTYILILIECISSLIFLIIQCLFFTNLNTVTLNYISLFCQLLTFTIISILQLLQSLRANNNLVPYSPPSQSFNIT